MIKTNRRKSSGYIIESFEDRSDLFKGGPKKTLSRTLVQKSGRDQRGRVTIRHRGGGARRKLRIVETLDKFQNIPAEIVRIEYDPNRSANIALLKFENGKMSYVIAPIGLELGKKIVSSDNVEMEAGNRSRLKNIPVGTQICDIQLYPDSKSMIARSAGTSATLMAIDQGYALVKLPSGELRKIHSECFATIGQVSNPEHSNLKIGMAGRKRRMGIRPTVRGKVMSPRSHPHGGGEGVNPIGLKYPKTPWGKVAIGKKTRRSKISDKFIIKSRTK